MQKIDREVFGKKLWDDAMLKDPCRDDMLAYNIAYTANELGDAKKAERYYKIASTNSGAPLASRFLGPLMRARE